MGWVWGSASSASSGVGIYCHMMHVAEDDRCAVVVVMDVELVGRPADGAVGLGFDGCSAPACVFGSCGVAGAAAVSPGFAWLVVHGASGSAGCCELGTSID